MKLFDGSENYELGNVSLTTGPNMTDTIGIELYKNVNTTQELELSSGTKVLLIGKSYDVEGINISSLSLFINNVGHFNIHPTYVRENERIEALKEMLHKHTKASLNIKVKLKGDNVIGETGLQPFEIVALATKNNWSFTYHKK